MKQFYFVIVLSLLACSGCNPDKNESAVGSISTTLKSQVQVNHLSSSGVAVAASAIEVPNQPTAISSVPTLQIGAYTAKEQDFVGIKHDINDSKTPINGYIYREYWGRWFSRTSGKRYMIGIANLPNEENPGAIFLEEVKEIRPGESAGGIDRTATIRAAALIKESNNFLSVNGDYCYPNERTYWTPNYQIIAVLSPMLEKQTREEIYGGSGIAAVAHQAWFLDVDNEKLSPLSEKEMEQIVCMDRKW